MFDFPIHSPVEEITLPFTERFGVRLFIKRDDMIHPFISGNKWRKLKYHLIKAREEGKTHLVTFGGIWSNHLLATACAAAKYGFRSTALVRGENIETETLLFCRMFGMQLHFVDRDSYRDKQKLYDSGFKDDGDAYFIDEGGAGTEALKGCEELLEELPEAYDHIFVAAGTGTTAVGTIRGVKKLNLPSLVHVIPVLKGADFLLKDIRNQIGEAPLFHFHTGYHFGGYAKTTTPLLEFIKDFSSKTGILLDPVYTGKMVYAVSDLISSGYFKPGAKILTIHTGGLFGLLGMKEKLFSK